MNPVSGIQIAIDRGGTFCDVIAKIPGQQDYVFKLLSVDPANYRDAPTEGIRRVLERAHGTPIAPNTKLELSSIASIRMGTTVATNALLERKGARVALVTTKGFRDVLAIGNQTRPHIFDLTARKLGHLYTEVVEVDERVTVASFSEGGGHALGPDEGEENDGSVLVEGVTGDTIRVLRAPDYEEVRKKLAHLQKSAQIDAVAVCLLHLYAYPEHEARVAHICRDLGLRTSVLHVLQPMIGMVNRTLSTVADAYLLPVIDEYLEGFGAGFKGGLEAFGNKLLFMQSNGGLCPWYRFTGLKSILLGPAGGMVGYAHTCYDEVSGKATLGFDAGGTSTDVSRFLGLLEHIYETVVSEVSLQTPQLDILTVAAGGGSILFWKNGMFVVGPELAGLDPGPACYRKGGPLTVTDANLLLGRLVADHFPRIFGPNHDQGPDIEVVRAKFDALTKEINADKGQGGHLTPEDVASGFLTVAVEAMARPIRNLTEARGFATAAHNLALFGGLGGQFAVALAKNLAIETVAIHRYSLLLLAHGIQLADIVIEKQLPASFSYGETAQERLDKRVELLVAEAHADCVQQGLPSDNTRVEVLLNMRYVGLDTHLLVENGPEADKHFVARHRAEFGFTLDRKVLVDDIQVLLYVQNPDRRPHNPFEEHKKGNFATADSLKTEKRPVYFEGWTEALVYQLGDLAIGSSVQGPAVIIDDTQTVVVDPQALAAILKDHIVLTVENEERPALSQAVVDPIQLLVFGHRFMSIAEQMGRTLQQTAISTNIKERLDFSCALFDAEGDLVANAPHVPIHLGAMSFAVKAQKELWEGKLEHGDVLVSNHPLAGGSHLPDITVITPVLDELKKPIFWTASRGHHADIGSISAGSMPPNSKTIFDEGAAIVSHKLCSNGKFDEAGITRLLVDEPAKHPGGSGTRTLSDNLLDLKAQVAANYKGITLLQALVTEFSYPVIDLYMGAIQETAERAVRGLLKVAHAKFHGRNLQAVDSLDDGTAIAVQITIDPETGDSVFDFTGSGDQIYGNLNAPKAILYLAVLYVLRLLISSDIPLNNGCLRPISFRTRQGSVVDPDYEAAVVGGNVETTQRIVDVMLKAFEAAAASQGTCNNFTFGINDRNNNISFGYYETICGGSGAGPSWDGQSVVQCHTTNTRITDVELFEKRYPVLLHEYAIRRGSGGDGMHRGGDGVVRDIEFRYTGLEVSCLMERRAMPPFGLLGGKDGLRGQNFWYRRSEKGEYRRVSLGGKTTVKVQRGDRVVILTPGGGGFGEKGTKNGESGSAVGFDVKSTAPSILTGSVGMRNRAQETN